MSGTVSPSTQDSQLTTHDSTKTQEYVRPPALWPFNILFGPVLLAVAIVVATILTDQSYASYMTAQVAPSVLLSNGAKLTITVAVDDTPAALRQVAIVLHAPHGVTSAGFGYDERGAIESIRVADDLPPTGSGQLPSYGVSVTVKTDEPPVRMTVTLGISGAPCASSSVPWTGTTDKVVRGHLSC